MRKCWVCHPDGVFAPKCAQTVGNREVKFLDGFKCSQAYQKKGFTLGGVAANGVELNISSVNYIGTIKSTEKWLDASARDGRPGGRPAPRTQLVSRYQTGAVAKNWLGGDGGCRGDW